MGTVSGFTKRALRAFALCSTGGFWAVAAQAAPPAAGSLPGAFSTNISGTTYLGTGTAGTIKIGTTAAAGQVLQFGGTALAVGVTPTGVTAANAGFSIGAGGTLALTGGGAVPTLVNDETGNPSQIYGTLTATGLGGPLFVANASGVVVGAGGRMNAPTAGIGLLGYAAGSAAFAGAGTLSVGGTTAGTGAVTVANGANVSGTLLVAGNGAVNIGAGSNISVIAGSGFTTKLSGGATPGAQFAGTPSAVVNFTGGSLNQPMTAALIIAPTLNNTGVVDATVASASPLGSIGTFTNTGTFYSTGLSAGTLVNNGVLNAGAGEVQTTNMLTNAGTLFAHGLLAGQILNNGVVYDSGGLLETMLIRFGDRSIVNNGTINESANSLLIFAGSGDPDFPVIGDFTNKGIIAFSTLGSQNSLTIRAESTYFGGMIRQAPAGSTQSQTIGPWNYLANFTGESGLTDGCGYACGGVFDIATNIYATNVNIASGAIRVLTGGIFGASGSGGSNVVNLSIGEGPTGDPLTLVTAPYNLDLAPLTTINAAEINVTAAHEYNVPVGDTANVNLDGVLSMQTAVSNPAQFAPESPYEILLTGVNNVTGAGGFALANDGVLKFAGLTGNVDQPAAAPSQNTTALLRDFVPVNVAAPTGGGTGTGYLEIGGPSAFSGTPQTVNLLVNGNAVLVDAGKAGAGFADGIPVIAPASDNAGAPATLAPLGSATNNRLIVQATGNINIAAAASPNASGPGNFAPGNFYWPGALYLSTIQSQSNPMVLSKTGSITLGNTNTALGPVAAVNLNNALPAVTQGNAGIYFETYNLVLNKANVTTNANSAVQFAYAGLANKFKNASAGSFFDAPLNTATNLLQIQPLPASGYAP